MVMDKQQREICEMCENYSVDTECEDESRCKIAELVKENNRLKAEVKRLKTENSNLQLKMSYMHDPNAIGDRHEMGAW